MVKNVRSAEEQAAANPESTLGFMDRGAWVGTLFAALAAAAVATLGLVVIVGWIIDSDALKGSAGVPITVKFNTAVCLLITAVAVGLSSSSRPTLVRMACALGLPVALIGAITLLEHLTGWNLWIDNLFFKEAAGSPATASPGRMGPPAAISFLFLGTGLIFLRRPVVDGLGIILRLLPLLVIVVTLVPLIGYAFDSPALYAAPKWTGIAWPTAIALFLVSLAMIASRPDHPLMRLVTSSSPGGTAVRKVVFPAFLPIAIVFLYGAANYLGWVETPTGRGLLALVLLVTLPMVALVMAKGLARTAEQRALAESQMRVSQAELEDFFENAVVGLHCVDAEGTILRANQADMDMLGYGREEYIGRPIAFFHVRREACEDILARLRTGERVRDYPAQLRCKDGSVKEVLIDASARFEGGRFVHTRTVTRDVSAHREAELAARRLSAIVESSNDAIVGKTLEGIVTSWNGGAEHLFGYTAEEMIGQSITRIIPQDRADEERAILGRIRQCQKLENFESVRQRKDGQLIDVSLTISPILDRHGQVVGASKIARDITGRKRAEAEREQLLESERSARVEAERAARMRDEFLAVVSHELRTPLNGILGWSQFLKRSRPDDATYSEGVDAIERGARAQAQLIEDLLDMNRIMSGKFTLELRPLRLDAVIESALATVHPAAESKEIRLTSLLDTKIGAIMGDPTRLQQAIWNLLSNAVKFTPKGGRISILLQRQASHVEIRISDTGIGIEPDFVPHVFERFRQADASTTRSYGGLGLGLSIVKHLIELHGGTVSVESPGKGHGATFTLAMPIASVQEETHRRTTMPPSASAVGVDLSDVKVLVVDDDQEARELIKRVLMQHNATVHISSSASEALNVLREWRPNVLLSDIGMPQMDGYQFIRKVREDLDAVQVPAVALTAYARSEDRTRAMLAGFQMHISKPVEPQELVATVASFVGRTMTN